jgi:hypothetical protein
MTLTCARCGSPHVIPDAQIYDQGQYSNHDLQVVVAREPDALIFKQHVFGRLRARVCGTCGHTELHTHNHAALYQVYQQAGK